MNYKFNLHGIQINSNEDIDEGTAMLYIDYIRKNNPKKQITRVELIFDGADVKLGYYLRYDGFEKLRRITGYLVGTVDRFNGGKRAEERDRLKHL